MLVVVLISGCSLPLAGPSGQSPNPLLSADITLSADGTLSAVTLDLLNSGPVEIREVQYDLVLDGRPGAASLADPIVFSGNLALVRGLPTTVTIPARKILSYVSESSRLSAIPYAQYYVNAVLRSHGSGAGDGEIGAIVSASAPAAFSSDLTKDGGC